MLKQDTQKLISLIFQGMLIDEYDIYITAMYVMILGRRFSISPNGPSRYPYS